MISAKASTGCAPEMRIPLTKKAGVPSTPAAEPAARSASTAAATPGSARHVFRAPRSSPAVFAAARIFSSLSFGHTAKSASCMALNFCWRPAHRAAMAALTAFSWKGSG